MVAAVSTFAQEQPAVMTSLRSEGKFRGEVRPIPHTLAQADPGKARIDFVQDTGAVNCLGSCGAKIGLDGAWAGANKGNSYFSVSVEPGEHHLCARMGPQLSPHTVALAHFTAEAGKVYYFRVRPFAAKDHLLNIEPIDSDEAKFLIASYPLSESHSKPKNNLILDYG